MAQLYVTETHRGLQITWAGTDLTGLAGGALQAIFVSKQGNTRFTGTGVFSAPLVTTVNGRVQSQTNYTPSVGDVAAAKAGEWWFYLKATWGDGTIDYSTADTVELLPLL